MKEQENENPQPRDRILAVKVTAKEKMKVTQYAARKCVNVSALIRQLLFERLKQDV